MTPERWADVDRVWHAVLARPDAERAAAIAELCAGDEELRAEVESLLAHLARASAAGFGVAPAVVGGASLVGCRLGPYAVHQLLGAGGMGEVYRAHDSTLGRDVALKILPDHWMDDRERRARFDREARLLASMNHPNIGAIYGVHETDTPSGPATKVLVLELVEGETLTDRIVHQHLLGRGLSVDDVRMIASQVLDALEAAHEHGIVHRDLKPGNIKITPEGRVKVLDFGLARELGVETGAAARLSPSPAITLAGTGLGVLLGTAAYMSPEQARGKAADTRSDIWAFGSVLYELLTGKRAFVGEAFADVIANVIKADPDWSALPADTPPSMRLCLERCLRKDPRQRLHHVADVRLAMEGAFEGRGGRPDNNERARRSSLRLSYAAWAAVFVAIAAGFGLIESARRTPPEVPETRFEIVTPPTRAPASLAISPDGRGVVFATAPGEPLWLRRLEWNAARPLMGTADGTMPFWSPDGQSIGFFANSLLKRIDLRSEVVRALASAPQPRRGAWSADGTILFGAGSVGPLFKVPAESGSVQPATTLLPGQTNHRMPQFLPDGKQFLLFALGGSDVRGVYLGSLGSTNIRRLTDRGDAYAFMPPSYLLFAKQGALWARTLNLGELRAEGEFVPVASKVVVDSSALGDGAFSTSPAGSVAYRTSAGETQLVWLDRTGRVVRTLGQPDDSQILLTGLSLDGQTAAVSRVVDGNIDAWLVDAERGAWRRLTIDPADDGGPILSPDGGRVAYVSDGKADVNQIYELSSSGTGEPKILFESAENKNLTDWSSDGRYLIYINQSSDTNYDLWALPMYGDRKPFAIAQTPFAELSGRFSPDAHWVTYSSTETGKAEIYLQRFPELAPKLQVSVGGGTFPRWRRDGRELFYLGPDSRLMSVSVARNGNRLDMGPPRPLFTLPRTSRYEPSPDGQRFLVTAVVSEASPISVILNWKPPVR